MTELDVLEITDNDVETVVSLWRRAGLVRPWNDPTHDIAFARQSGHATILVGRVPGADAIVASVMVGHDGHRGAAYYLSVDPDCRGRGYGRAIMAAAEARLRARGVWKLNLMVRADNAAAGDFYRALGYEVEDRLNFAKWLDPSAKPEE